MDVFFIVNPRRECANIGLHKPEHHAGVLEKERKV